MNNLFIDYKLSNNSWFGLGGKAKKFFTPDTEEELIDFAFIREKGLFNKAFKWIQNNF